MNPNASRPSWSLAGTLASQRHTGLSIDLDLARPDRGLVTMAADGRRDHLLGVGVAARSAATADTALRPTEQWLRGVDLAAIYEPRDARELRTTAMWRFRDEPSGIHGWELVVSAQTSLLEADAALVVISDIEATDLLWSAPQTKVWRPFDDHSPLPADAAWILGRRGREGGGATSVLVAVHPADRRRITVSRTAGRGRIECWLFPEPLEKGVLLRSRVLAAIGPRANDEDWASRIATAFTASSAPLTT
jgi:hypothetical protein